MNQLVSISGTAIVYSRGRIGISASLFFGFMVPPFPSKQKSVKSVRSSISSDFTLCKPAFCILNERYYTELFSKLQEASEKLQQCALRIAQYLNTAFVLKADSTKS